MDLDRRTLLRGIGAAALMGRGAEALMSVEPASRPPDKSYDAVVAGAGCFGAWIAWHLRRTGRSVLLLDPYGPAHARASSGGESRVIRMAYGPDEVYTRFSLRSLGEWQSLFGRIGRPELFQPTGVLWMAYEGNPQANASLATLTRVGVRHERLSAAELARRWPQMAVEPNGWAIWEPESGVILARRAVAAVVADAVAAGVDYALGAALAPEGSGRLGELRLASGDRIAAGAVVYACGPWLGKVLPAALAERIFPTRQEVYFFGVPAGDMRFGSPALPTFIDFAGTWYGLPDLERRGFKIANDSHGPAIDPDTAERVVSPDGVAAARSFLATRFPAMAGAPLVESRVCQYENTSNGDFVIDRHPGFDNVWIAGGGSGHGFKHGPAVGAYLAGLIASGAPAEPRFALAGKEKMQHRAVF